MKRLLLFSSALFFALNSNAQFTGPEQDCIGAIEVCQPVFVQTNSYNGIGMIDDLPGGSSCLQAGENNSVWYVIEIADSGDLMFDIIPFGNDDYDFALFDITNHTCADINNGVALEVRCNYAFTNGPTGLGAGYTNVVEGPGGLPYNAPLPVIPGHRFVLMIDNFSSTSFGYTLDFSSSTATLADPNGPVVKSINKINCASDSLIALELTGRVQCTSIAPDGSDFTVTGPSNITITGAEGINCSQSNFTTTILIRYTGLLQDGNTYTLHLQDGTDGNSLLGFCGLITHFSSDFVVEDSTGISVVADFGYTSFQKRGFFYQTSQNALEYSWDLGNGATGFGPGTSHTYASGGAYQVCLTARGVCSSDTICKQVYIESNEISGRVYLDINKDCMFNSSDRGLSGRIVVSNPGPFYTMTNSAGNYSIFTNPGTHTISRIVNPYDSWLIKQFCPANFSTQTVTLTNPYDDAPGINFADTAILCPILSVRIANGWRRMCMESATSVIYCNDGFGPAENVVVRVVYPPYISLTSASHLYIQTGVNTYEFAIGTLLPGQCGTIRTIDMVTCSLSAMGFTQCVEAFIDPPNTCFPPSQNWSSADLQVSGVCVNNNLARFIIVNAGTGSMTDSLEFTMYFDSLQVGVRKFKLNAGDSLMVQVPPQGQTVRLEVEQVPFHPHNLMVSATIEGCSVRQDGTVSTGFVPQFPPNNRGNQHAVGCGVLLNSYDPNDKLAMPEGVSENHYILPSTKIEYTIRFQNTGNDTAYNVMIWDTLSPYFDLSTLQIGGSSHDFEVSMTGEGLPVLVFFFNDIYLPDSATNPLGSEGFVSFSIMPYDTLPVFTRIENRAAIYFDINPPIITNTFFHIISNTKFISSAEVTTITTTYLPATSINEITRVPDLHLFPNPTDGRLFVNLSQATAGQFQAEVLDMYGKTVYRQPVLLLNEQFELDLNALAKGVYLLRVSGREFSMSKKFSLLR